MNLAIKRKTKYIFAFFVVAAFLMFGSSAFAATVSLGSSVSQVDSGALFSVSVNVNSQGQAINNAEAVINFPPDLVQVTSLNLNGSIFSLWVEQPAFSNTDGTVTFNGGIPNPGYTGAGGHILTIQFKSKAPGAAQFTFASAAVRANDGLGTDVLNGSSGATISIVQSNAPTPTPPSPLVPPVYASSNNGEVLISSATYPNSSVWYSQPNGTFSWTLPQGSLASQTSLDRTQGTTPRVLRKPPVSSIAIANTPDGVWYFNARFETASGWSKIYSYKIQIDATPPDSVVITNGTNNAAPTLSAHDALSGIDYYMVQVDGAAAVKITPTATETPINIPGINEGTHLVQAVAYDLAGNSATTTANVVFPQSIGAAITYYSKAINEGDRIVVNGMGPRNSNVNIELVAPDGVSRTYNSSTTDSGTFVFQSEPIAETGTYTLWAQTNSSSAAVSPHVQIVVNPSLFTRITSALKSSATPTNIIILILSILCILGWMNYFLLKKSIRAGTQGKNSKSDS